MEEVEEALSALIDHPALRSESYLSPMNGTSAKCSQGVPESLQTQTNLAMGGFEKTEAGLAEAIVAGWAHINLEEGGQMVLATGGKALAHWRAHDTDTTVSFKVNPAEPRLRLATAKRPSGAFAVDCLSTDGGGIPRNARSVAQRVVGALAADDLHADLVGRADGDLTRPLQPALTHAILARAGVGDDTYAALFDGDAGHAERSGYFDLAVA